ncbi:MAG: acetyl-CoA C-acyltransferase [Bacteroidota bacterium]|jgi:acetyl-CoA C-acetyltransferase|nr:acetyl-CoA C-acyltransferase [Chitinophagaceae bacterium]MCE2758678.1 acetyl-CoA C-acyltransferase [Chitinophagaceae bacterium]
MKKEICIVSASRTPIGSFGGALKSFTATQLGGKAIEGAIKKIRLNPSEVDEVIMGVVLQAGLGQAPARQAAIYAGLPSSVVTNTVNKVCASGMKAIALGVQSIEMGDAEVVIAGGMESMSNVPFYNHAMRWGHKYGSVSVIDGLAHDGLTDHYDQVAMGSFADQCASEYKISREDQDAFAIASYQKSQAAIKSNGFQHEVVPIEIPQKKGAPIIVEHDEEPFKVQFDKIASLNPAFTKEGTVTAANASTMNDGSAAVVLMTVEKAKALGLTPLAIIRGCADAEQDPCWFTTSPAKALPLALSKANLRLNDIDYFEFNEAFSVVGIVNSNILNIDPSRVNIKGGAVSLGHPLGCSGARIIVTLIHILLENKARFGAAAICNGGGGASAMVLEAV